MAVTEVKGKKFWQIYLGTDGGDYEMTVDFKLREVRLTGIVANDYMVFYEAYGSNPVIFQLDYYNPTTFFHGNLTTKIGFIWANCSIATPANAVLSFELE